MKPIESVLFGLIKDLTFGDTWTQKKILALLEIYPDNASVIIFNENPNDTSLHKLIDNGNYEILAKVMKIIKTKEVIELKPYYYVSLANVFLLKDDRTSLIRLSYKISISGDYKFKKNQFFETKLYNNHTKTCKFFMDLQEWT